MKNPSRSRDRLLLSQRKRAVNFSLQWERSTDIQMHKILKILHSVQVALDWLTTASFTWLYCRKIAFVYAPCTSEVLFAILHVLCKFIRFIWNKYYGAPASFYIIYGHEITFLFILLLLVPMFTK